MTQENRKKKKGRNAGMEVKKTDPKDMPPTELNGSSEGKQESESLLVPAWNGETVERKKRPKSAKAL